MVTATETGSDEEEDEDEDQMYVNGMRGGGKKKFLFCVCQASSVPWDWNGIPGCGDYGAYNLAYYLISKSSFRDAKYLVEESRLPPIWTKRVRKSTGGWTDTGEWTWTYVRGDVAGDEVISRDNQLFVGDTDSDLFSADIGAHYI